MSLFHVCSACGYLRGYASGSPAPVAASCPLCEHDLLSSSPDDAFPPAYVAQTRRTLRGVPELGRGGPGRRRGEAHDRPQHRPALGGRRVRALRAAIESGSYSVEPAQVAQSMLLSPAVRDALQLR